MAIYIYGRVSEGLDEWMDVWMDLRSGAERYYVPVMLQNFDVQWSLYVTLFTGKCLYQLDIQRMYCVSQVILCK